MNQQKSDSMHSPSIFFFSSFSLFFFLLLKLKCFICYYFCLLDVVVVGFVFCYCFSMVRSEYNDQFMYLFVVLCFASCFFRTLPNIFRQFVVVCFVTRVVDLLCSLTESNLLVVASTLSRPPTKTNEKKK